LEYPENDENIDELDNLDEKIDEQKEDELE
jgi:hypothetical protein